MAHNVKCTVCGKTFNRDKIQAVKVGARRYAHYMCKKDGELVPLENTGKDNDLIKLEEYLSKLFGENYNYARVNKQIKDFKENYDYTYSGMLKTLIWWYEIKGNPKDKAQGGIGIIPFVYQDALKYYYNLYMAQQINESVSSYKIKVKEIEIAPPKAIRKPIKMFNAGGDI